MTRKLFRRIGNEWCSVQIQLENGRLSISGHAGEVVTRARAKRMAVDYWADFFVDSPEEILNINRRFDKRFTSAMGAAHFVIQMDGKFHGLDVEKDDGKEIYLVDRGGQIIKDIKRFFPEVTPYLAWHLNDCHAECEHQETRGETYKTHPGAVCPDCGWKLGHGWCKRALPDHVIAWAEGR